MILKWHGIMLALSDKVVCWRFAVVEREMFAHTTWETEHYASLIYLCNNRDKEQTLYIQIVGASLTAAEPERKLLGVSPLPLRIKLASGHAVILGGQAGKGC